jgi:hypothetical protein
MQLLEKSDMVPLEGTWQHFVVTQYAMISFCMFIVGSISFVLSLEEGFFAYQFTMLGWSLLSLICIVTGGTGWLFGLWGCRLWFIYPISALCVHNMVDYIVCRYCPFHTPLSLLKP